MWRVIWRNLVARKVRLALSGVAIVLGVAFVSGSFIFTDAMAGAFNGIIKGSTADVEIAPTGANDVDSGQDSRTIPAAVAERLEALPEAESVHPFNQLLTLYVIGSDGKVVGGNVSILRAAPFAVQPGTWYQLRLDAIGNRLRAYVNGVLLLETTDLSLATGNAGPAMFKAATDYDDFAVYQP